MQYPPNKMPRNIHNHTWLVGVPGIFLGCALLIYVPSLLAVSTSLMLMAVIYLLGGLLTLASLYIVVGRRIWRHIHRPALSADKVDYGWGGEWMNGLAVVASVIFLFAIIIQLNHPYWWPLAFLITLLGASFMVGNFIMGSFRSNDYVVLPMVSLLRSDNDLVLDAGCGTGRTTIALSRQLGNGRVVAVDRFDAGYIHDGGRALLEHNLRSTGLHERVDIERADLTSLPFEDNKFDSAVSTNVFDHLGPNKQQCLNEIYRVLKPGGRFLLAVWVPSWQMFTIGNLLSLLLTSRARWRLMAQLTGFSIEDQGIFNFAWFVLLEKPRLTEMKETP